VKLFSRMYDAVLRWSQHAHAQWILAALSFSEAIFFPIPPDVMLAPMAMTQPKRAFRFAGITTLTSVLGGCVGFVLGMWAYDAAVLPFVELMGYQDKLATIVSWFEHYGIWVVFLAGFSPIPYKLFTVSAGMLSMAFLPFLLASAVSRGLRFYLVAWLLRWGGPAMAIKLRTYVDRIGWATVIIAVLVVLVIKLVS